MKSNNPYSLNLNQIREESVLKGALEADVPVFLHGKSGDGKSARVKQFDNDCVVLYLRNLSPDMLNGKTVYNSNTNEAFDIPPSWYNKIVENCEKEPDKIHILFFDELTNALPSIQGSAFNIVLNKEVNGKWKLPKNCRIVAAGNELDDSLAANELVEPLFGRFAHEYITTTSESWLHWAMGVDLQTEKLPHIEIKQEHRIHPSIIGFIALKGDEVLRTKYTGREPNADPRKWELASKMLYATNNPYYLRSLIGEDLTNEFIKFCTSKVITLDDVLSGNYTKEEVEKMSLDEKYATICSLVRVNEEQMPIVRKFIQGMDKESLRVFDKMWIGGDINRVNLIKVERDSVNKSKITKKSARNGKVMTFADFWDAENQLGIICSEKWMFDYFVKAADLCGEVWSNGGTYKDNADWSLYKSNTVFTNDELCIVSYDDAVKQKIWRYNFADIDFSSILPNDLSDEFLTTK